jgi:hypothetical protein
MSFSNYLENEILDHVLGNASWSAPGTVYVALGTALSADGDSFTEVTGNNYSRVSVTNNATNWPAASSGWKQSGTAITFPTATPSGWGIITHFAIFDASTGGNMLIWGALESAELIISGNNPEFQSGNLGGDLD